MSDAICAIQQAAAVVPCQYVIAPSAATFSAAGGSGVVDVQALDACGWHASSPVGWVSLTGASTGQGNGRVSYLVAAHVGHVERTTALTVAGHAHLITQAGASAPPAPCVPTVSPTRASFTAAGGTGTFQVGAPSDCEWTAVETASWLTVTAPRGGQGSGDARVEFSVAQHAGADTRSATIRVGDARFTVDQTGTAACTYSVAPTEVELAFSGTPWGGRVEVQAGAGCPWTAATDAPWIALHGPTAGSGSATVRYDVGLYTGTPTRRAAIMLRWPSPHAGAERVDHAVRVHVRPEPIERDLRCFRRHQHHRRVLQPDQLQHDGRVSVGDGGRGLVDPGGVGNWRRGGARDLRGTAEHRGRATGVHPHRARALRRHERRVPPSEHPLHVVYTRGSERHGISGADTASCDAALMSQPVGRPVQRVNVDFPVDLLRDIDQEARRLGVTRQAFIKVRLADALVKSTS